MKIIVIVDMQNDFVTGCLGSSEAQAIVPVMIDRLKEYNSGENLVLFTKDTHYDNYMDTQEGKNLPVPHCIEGTEGWSIVKDISSFVDYGSHFCTYSAADIIKSRILKNTFGSTQLAEIIEDIVADGSEDTYTVDEVIFMGVCTDICVISNVMLVKAHCPELLVTVDASCCAGVTPESHRNALAAMKMCQVNVINE